jgi:hypothetical protein
MKEHAALTRLRHPSVTQNERRLLSVQLYKTPIGLLDLCSKSRLVQLQAGGRYTEKFLTKSKGYKINVILKIL